MLRGITIPTLLFSASALVAQTPFSESFFMGERKAILKACAGQARSMKPRDAKLLAECGRYFMAGGDWHRFIEFGRAFLVGGHRKEAASWFSRACILKPGEERVYLEVARAFAEAGR